MQALALEAGQFLRSPEGGGDLLDRQRVHGHGAVDHLHLVLLERLHRRQVRHERLDLPQRPEGLFTMLHFVV